MKVARTLPIEGADAMPPEELIPLVVAQQVLAIVVEGSLPGETARTVDPDMAIDGVILALAVMLEQAPEFPTHSALRKASDQFAKRLKGHSRAMRDAFEQTGVHPIDRLLNRWDSASAERPN